MSRTRKNLLLIGCVSAVVVPGVFLFYMLSARVDRGTTPEMVCWTNLRNIDTAEEVWAIENHKTTNDTPSWGDLQKSLYSTNMICPAGGTYTLAGVGKPPTCSIPAHAALYSKNRGPTWSPKP